MVTGESYDFKVQARNEEGYGYLSDPTTVLAASVPSQPDMPVTIWNNALSQVTIDWNEPSINGAAILSYSIYILKSDAITYASELTSCDGSSSSVKSATACVIPVATLRAEPFSL